MSLLFNKLSRLVITFLPRNKHLFISSLHSQSAVILEPKKIKFVTDSIVSLSICHGVMGPDAMILVFWMLSFMPVFSLCSFIKRLFSSASLSVIRVVLSTYLRLLIFLLAILIPACTSSNLAFLMKSSTCKLKKKGDNKQPWRLLSQFGTSPCPMLSSNCSFLTYIQVFPEASKVIWYFYVLKNLPSLLWSTQGLWRSQWSRSRCFFWNSLAFSMIQQMLAIWSLVSLPFLNLSWTSGSFQFMYCWSLVWRILSITLLACEMRLTMVVWTFFGIAFFLGIGMKTPFSVLWPLLSYPNLLAYWCSTFTASSFRIWIAQLEFYHLHGTS